MNQKPRTDEDRRRERNAAAIKRMRELEQQVTCPHCGKKLDR